MNWNYVIPLTGSHGIGTWCGTALWIECHFRFNGDEINFRWIVNPAVIIIYISLQQGKCTLDEIFQFQPEIKEVT
jgi:hypothetical protein